MSGGNGTAAGAELETSVREIIGKCGITPRKQTRLNVRGPFGEWMYSDVTIDPCRAFPLGLIIQCKNQDSTGSAHQKLVYLHECIKHYYRQPCVVVCGGTSDEIQVAYEWLKARVGGMLWGVYRREEFALWIESSTKNHRTDYLPGLNIHD